MDEPRIVPHPSCAEIEHLFTDGSEARYAETSQPDSSANPSPTAAAANLPGRPHVTGQVPASLRRFVDSEDPTMLSFEPDADGHVRVVLSPMEIADIQAFDAREKKRDALFSQLIFAARNLAQARLIHTATYSVCADCSAVADAGLAVEHRALCRVHPVLSIVAELALVSAAEAECAVSQADGFAGQNGGAQ